MKNKKPKSKKVLDDVEKYCQRHTPTAKHPLLFSENFSQKNQNPSLLGKSVVLDLCKIFPYLPVPSPK